MNYRVEGNFSHGRLAADGFAAVVPTTAGFDFAFHFHGRFPRKFFGFPGKSGLLPGLVNTLPRLRFKLCDELPRLEGNFSHGRLAADGFAAISTTTAGFHFAFHFHGCFLTLRLWIFRIYRRYCPA
jgi:hypothetical protein